MNIKLLNINAWLGGQLWESLTQYIQEQNVDIVTIQEVYDGHDAQLRRQLRTVDCFTELFHYPYHVFSPSFLDRLPEGKIDRGNLILSRFPIKETQNRYLYGQYGEFSEQDIENFSYFPRSLQEAAIIHDNKLIHVFNLQGIWDLSGKDNADKLRMSEVIVDAVKNKENVILAGDFNISPGTKTIDLIEEHLVNVFGRELTTSFNMKRKTQIGYATAVVDMIFVSKNIKVISKSCPLVDISDHLPLIAQLEI